MIRRDAFDEELQEYTIEGQIATLDKASRKKLQEIVTLKIDGEEISVPRVVLARDADNNQIVDEDGEATYRYTTIYDAAIELFESSKGERNPIPIVCHREHMRPAAVCRVCMVEVNGENKLVPACHRIVDNGSDIRTIKTSSRVENAVKMVVELLMSDQPPPKDPNSPPELHLLAKRLGVSSPRFDNGAAKKGKDNSSTVIAVDHAACILCDRCVRACDEVKENFVIGRNGKGYKARIGFDLNFPMGQSSCVSCGECAISCPTDALTHKEVSHKPVRISEDREGTAIQVQPNELVDHRLFSGISPKFLRLNKEAIVRRRFKKGDIVCREGESGSTAFIIERGNFEVLIQSDRGNIEKSKTGLFGFLRQYSFKMKSNSKESVQYITTDSGSLPLIPGKKSLRVMTPEDILFGEMTCMNFYPRSTTVRALDDDCEVLEVQRNVLYMVQRNSAARRMLEKLYSERSLNSHLYSVSLFARVAENKERFKELEDFIRQRLNQGKVQLVRVEPGQTIFRQGDPGDYFYMVRIGFVKVSESGPGGEFVKNYVGPGGSFGEIALLSLDQKIDLLRDFPNLPGRPTVLPGVRTASCAAVDHVELVRIPLDDFREMYQKFPEIRAELVRRAYDLLSKEDRIEWNSTGQTLGDFLGQGLMNAQSLLVLDLESCTRCDECTKACSDSHAGVTRLIREGLRYDKYLVASSCRSCQDPYCMVGCPTGAIQRTASLEMTINDNCIGCGKCASNCPYGNINMHPIPTGKTSVDESTGLKKAVVEYKATICDLCRDTPAQDPSCVYACPHDAAHRMTGAELLEKVRAERGI